MIVRKWRKAGVVTLTCHIASVPSHKPLVGFSDAVEKAWRALKRKHRLKDRDPQQLCKVSSSTEILDRRQSPPSTSAPSPLVKSNTDTQVHVTMIRRDKGYFIWNRGLEPARCSSEPIPSSSLL